MIFRRILLVPVLMIISSSGYAQSAQTQAKAQPPQVFTYVEQMPEPSVDINAYVSKNLKYPNDAVKEGAEGRVVLHFIVNEDGTVSDVTVIRSVYPSLDSEAVRLIRTMPLWKPGKQNGKAVKVNYSFPLTFRITAPADIKK